MASDSINPYSFLSGFVQNNNLIRWIAQIDEIKNLGGNSSQLLRYSCDTKKFQYYTLQWHAIRLCVIDQPQDTIIAISPEGRYVEGNSSGPKEGIIDDSPEGTIHRGPIRDLRRIGEHVYAVGMGRQVYKRTRPDNWLRIDQDILQPRGVFEVSGFNSIDGLDEMNIYAVGFGGEIWLYNNDQWKKIESPTNVILHRVRVVKHDLVFIAGQQGLLIKGCKDYWQVIQHEATDSDFWGMEYFNGNLFIACDEGIFKLDKDDNFQKIDMGFDSDWTFRHLHANDGVMCSFGPKHIAWTDDAVTWHDITP